jgi:hypothetical protein
MGTRKSTGAKLTPGGNPPAKGELYDNKESLSRYEAFRWARA